jgi:N-acylneuraminate cytidylyltransferase
VIPARSGSRGLRHKNIQKVGGVPMLVRAVMLARASVRRGERWHIVVSTDSPDYARLARRAGAEVLLRPRRLATATARLIDVVLHALDEHQGAVDTVLMLSAATPLTKVGDVRRALLVHKRYGGSVVSVTRDKAPDSWRFAVRDGRLVVPRGTRVSRRQESEARFRLNGAIYLTTTARLRRNHQFVGPKTRVVAMPQERSVDVEDKLDPDWARYLCRRAGSNGDQRV